MSSFGSLSSSLKICFGVSGSGDAKISASRIDLSSALANRGASRPPGSICGVCPASPPGASSVASCCLSFMVCLRIANGMRRIGRTWTLVDANRPEAARLEDADQLQTDHLEQREERDDEAAAVGDIGEELLESARLRFREARQQLVDADLHRNLLGRQQDLRTQLRALDDLLERGQQAEEIDLELRLVVVAGN